MPDNTTDETKPESATPDTTPTPANLQSESGELGLSLPVPGDVIVAKTSQINVDNAITDYNPKNDTRPPQ